MTDAEHRRDGDRGKATLRETRDRGRMVRRRNVAAVAMLASLAACVSTKANQPPSSPSIAQPRICLLSASTTIFIKPRVSSTSSARAT